MRQAGYAARSCSFCGLPEGEVQRLVAGQGVHICNRCIALATAVVQEGATKSNDRVVLSLISDAEARCSFCGRTLRQARRMAGTAEVRMCADCVALCEPVVEEVFTPERQRELDRKFGRRPPGL